MMTVTKITCLNLRLVDSRLFWAYTKSMSWFVTNWFHHYEAVLMRFVRAHIFPNLNVSNGKSFHSYRWSSMPPCQRRIYQRKRWPYRFKPYSSYLFSYWGAYTTNPMKWTHIFYHIWNVLCAIQCTSWTKPPQTHRLDTGAFFLCVWNVRRNRIP